MGLAACSADMASFSSKITIADVARLAGVSKTTVSRYLNGQFHLLKDETKRVIEKTIEESGYYPSHSARSLKSQHTCLIGVVIADISTPFSSAVIQGIGNVLEPQGYVPIFVNCNGDPNKERQCIADLMAHDVEGLIVNSSSSQSPELLEIAKSGFPLVLCDRPVEELSCPLVTSDVAKAMGQMLHHLLFSGFALPYLFTENPEKSMVRKLRISQFLRLSSQLYQQPIPEDHVYVIDTSNGLATRRLLRRILDTAQAVPAILGVNTMTTIHLLGVLKAMGVKIPNEMGVCGPDDWSWGQQLDWASLIAPGISTIEIPARQIGEQSAEALLSLLSPQDPSAAPAGQTPYDGQAPAPVLISSRCVLRSSTDLSGSGRGESNRT